MIWEFLNYMLGRLGFGNRLREWMMKCYGTASYSILLNGLSLDYFHGSRGLCQSDPLSPFLFLVVVEVFGVLLTKAFQGGLMESFEIRGNGMMVFPNFIFLLLLFCIETHMPYTS